LSAPLASWPSTDVLSWISTTGPRSAHARRIPSSDWLTGDEKAGALCAGLVSSSRREQLAAPTQRSRRHPGCLRRPHGM